MSMTASEFSEDLEVRLKKTERRNRELEDALTRLEIAVDVRTAALQYSNAEFRANMNALNDAQNRLLMADRLAALGTLAAGVAHEVNNPIGVILGFAQSIEQLVPENDQLHLPVKSIVREALRCKSLVQELLRFSRTQVSEMESIDLSEVVRSTGVLLESRAKLQKVELRYSIDSVLKPIRANRVNLQQVIFNLGTNALDAMEQGGTLSLYTKANGENEVVLEVSDTGTGIPKNIRSRIFDPFFTTKEVGKGTGLGLSLVHEIVSHHLGKIDVESEDNKGTTMRVAFPVSDNTERRT